MYFHLIVELSTNDTLSGGGRGPELSVQNAPEVSNNKPRIKTAADSAAESVVIPGGEIYQNLGIPVADLPVYLQRMKEKEDGFQKEFEVFLCL